jgi:hypothetical protein
MPTEITVPFQCPRCQGGLHDVIAHDSTGRTGEVRCATDLVGIMEGRRVTGHTVPFPLRDTVHVTCPACRKVLWPAPIVPLPGDGP